MEGTFREKLLCFLHQKFFIHRSYKLLDGDGQWLSILGRATRAPNDVDQLDLGEPTGKNDDGIIQFQLELRALVVPDKYTRKLSR